MEDQRTELENQQNESENIETFEQSDLNDEKTIFPETIAEKINRSPKFYQEEKG